MGPVDPAEVPKARPLPAVGGLLVAGAVAASVCRLPRTYTLSWTEVIGAAVFPIVVVSLASIMAAWTLSALTPDIGKLELRRLVKETWLHALWLAPLAILIRERSLWTVVIAAAFAVVVMQSIRPVQDRSGLVSAEESLLRSLRSDNLPLSFRHDPQISFSAALLVQIGMLVALAGQMFPAAALVGTGFAIWTWSSARGASEHHGQCSAVPSYQERSFVVVGLVLLIMIGALLPYLPNTHGLGHFGSVQGNRRVRAASGGDQPKKPVRVTTVEASATTASEGDTGIILWPPKQPYTKLIAPGPALGAMSLTNSRAPNPLIIPFSGVYWFFKAPDLEPPKASRQAHASPEMVDIRSTDRRPLSIEAHDHLGSLIDLNCCSRIQITIRNADRYPESVALELVLVDTSLAARPSLSLGTMMVRSTHAWNLYEKNSPTSETLNFAIPTRPLLRRFDEVKIVFWLDRARADSGAKIAIDQFVLVPRGL
jgi:hypothetical protein